jgi:hypothetical protein
MRYNRERDSRGEMGARWERDGSKTKYWMQVLRVRNGENEMGDTSEMAERGAKRLKCELRD